MTSGRCRTLLLPGLLALALAGCSKPASLAPAGSPAGSAPAALAEAPKASADRSASAAPIAVGPALPQLAYSYNAQVQASPDAVAALLARHEAACVRAGPALCQVIGAERATERDGARAELKLRAQPAWLQGFRDGLAGDVQGLGGRLVGTSTVSEDLSRQIVDTDAALRAKTVLAERLQQLLATRQGKLSDLLEVETALAQTQGEIDAARSELAVMRGRVATSDLTLTYTSRAALAGAWKPVGEAVQGAAGVFAQVVAVLITLIAALLPLALLGALGTFLWRTLAARRRRAKAPTRSA